MKEITLKVMTIVHGQSEFYLCQSIKSNLKIKHEIIARNKGKISIQVESIMDILNDRRFKSISNFKKYFPDIEFIKKEPQNFKLFIIMDVDDCTPSEKRDFLSKLMFKNHWLYPYIVPIFNDPNLEATMKSLNIEIVKKKDYIKIFPTNHGDLNIIMAQELSDKLSKVKCTNLEEYIEYCINVSKNDAFK